VEAFTNWRQTVKRRYSWLIAVAFIVFTSPLGLLSAQATKDLPSCDAAKVTYSAFDASFADKIVVRKARSTELPVPTGEKKFSPQRARWLIVKEPNLMKPGPRPTTVSVSGTNSDSALLELSLIDHANGGTQTEWLNEKLLFVRVWWGRIVSTDLILDVEKMTFPYREMANYGEFTRPCE
jgi:hypothetical protein